MSDYRSTLKTLADACKYYRSGQSKGRNHGSGGGSKGFKRKYSSGGYEPKAKRARQSYQSRWRTS